MAFAVFLVKLRDVDVMTPLKELEQTNLLGESLSTKRRDDPSVPCPAARPQFFPPTAAR
jgi:hypothetical protein